MLHNRINLDQTGGIHCEVYPIFIAEAAGGERAG